ncbi:uncharacterized protein [Asterias amurensis]|uniref:uncharacterized protein n=1 Tax=Asterias amurensis TaxID=7602 RepID=UPI003AB67272
MSIFRTCGVPGGTAEWSGSSSDVSQDVVSDWHNGSMQVYGSVTRRYLTVFNKFDNGCGKLDRKELIRAFNYLKVFPSRSQVYSMLRCGRECSGRDSEDWITLGEFCVFAAEFEEYYQQQSCLNVETPVTADPRYNHTGPTLHSQTASMPPFKVFLGGSCNPTTWRKDIAIPHLNKVNLSYYNPQVENWTHELIAIEDEAKMIAELLLFVIDNSTRSVASLVEASYLSGGRRSLVLVMKGLPTHVDNEKISDNELKDLRHSHAFLCDLVERQCCPIFEDLPVALRCAAKVLTQGVHMSQLTLGDGAQPVRHPDFKVGDKLRNIKETFREFDSTNSGKISLSNAFLAIRAVTGKDLTFPAYDQIVASCQDSGVKTHLDFNEFCCLVTEYKYYEPPTDKGPFSRLTSSIYRWLSTFKKPSTPKEIVEIKTEVFLGGTCLHTSWREDIAIPILQQHNLTYFNPLVSDWNMGNIPLEAKAKETSLYLLFVISATSRGIASMIEVAHYIGQGRKVVLCIENMVHGVCVYDEKLSERAVRDYNRARCYLADLAIRQGVPFFNDIHKAMEALVGKLLVEHQVNNTQ